MPNRKVLVQVAGQIQQAQSGDTLVDGDGNPIGASADFDLIVVDIENATVVCDVENGTVVHS